MPHRNPFLKTLARINTKPPKPSTTPVFQPPFTDRPPLPIIRVTTSSSSTSLSSASTSPVIHNAPFPPDSPISPPTPPPSEPSYHLQNRHLRTMVLLLTPPLMEAASNVLSQQGYGTGPRGTVTEADEIDYLRTLDAFLCMLDPRYGEHGTSDANAGKGCWLEGMRSPYLDGLIRGSSTERLCRVKKWVVGKFDGEMELGAYVRVADGFLGVLEGRGTPWWIGQ